MSPKRIILVNPYIHDFAAHNLWARPIGLYKVAEFLSRYDVELKIIDCIDAPVKDMVDGRSHIQKVRIDKPAVYKNVPRYYHRFGKPIEIFKDELKAALPVDSILVTSHMSYWYNGVGETIDIIRDLAPNTTVTLGGIYATLYPEHAAQTLGANICAGPVGEGILDVLGLDTKVVSQGCHWSDLVVVGVSAPVVTSYGCPMKCTYCAVSKLHPEFTQLSVADVTGEIKLLHGKGVRHFAFYDDALLVNFETHLGEILQRIQNDDAIKAAPPHFYTPVGLQSRLITRGVARVLKTANFGYIRIGYETSDATRQRATGGKIYNDELEKGISYLREAGFASKDIGVFIMYGMPGQPFEDTVASVEYVKNLGVRLALTEFSPVRGTTEYTKLFANDVDPLVTNNKTYPILFGEIERSKIDMLKLKIKEHNAGLL